MKDHVTASAARTRLREEPGFQLFLASASVAEARKAAETAVVADITTNPTLMAKEGSSPIGQLERLLGAFPGPILHQPAAMDPPHAETELLKAWPLEQNRVACKLHARRDFIALAKRLQASGKATALTAVYGGGQALLAAAAEIPWIIIPCVNRAKRLVENGDRLVVFLADILRAARSQTRILAASVRSADEAFRAMLDGAHAISAPLEILAQLGDYPPTELAMEEFGVHHGDRNQSGGGRTGTE